MHFCEEVPFIQNVQSLFFCSCPGLTRGHTVRSMKSEGLQKEAVFLASWAPHLAGGSIRRQCVPSQGFVNEESLANSR